MIDLLPHNREASDKAKAHLIDNRKACIIQPTGCGKSFAGGAVAADYDKVLIVAPNNYVLEQASSVTPHAETMTYMYLSQRDDMPKGYDLIWFDEFHRIGAATWGKGVYDLCDANPNAKILGTSATPIRHLEQRDMAEEFFGGHIVSQMDLGDAWARHILRVPIYVIGTISMASVASDYKSRIKNAKRLNEEQKHRANSMLDNLIRDWSLSYGVDHILRKYIDRDVKRMVVFAQTIGKLNEVKSSLPEWFEKAGLKLANIYTVHSAMGIEADRQMRAFENDESEGIKVLVSVDMLNEGIHVDRVDAVMMLRSTISKNLYLQQMGRCFAVGQKHQPIILDLADNFTSACGYEGIYEARERYLKEAGQYTDEMAEERPYEGDEFMIIDTLKETRELIERLGEKLTANDTRSFEERFKDLEALCEQLGHLPRGLRGVKNLTVEQRTEANFNRFMWVYRDRPEIIELKKKYFDTRYLSDEEIADTIVAFCHEKHRLPKQKRVPIAQMTAEEKYENDLGRYMNKLIDNPKIQKVRLQYLDFRHMTTEEREIFFVNWCHKHKAFPIGVRNDKEQKTLAHYALHNPDKPCVIEMKRLYNFKSVDERKAEKRVRLIEFFKNEQRNPRESAESREERELAHFMRHCIRRENDEEIRGYYEQFYSGKHLNDDEFMDIYEAFCKKNGHKPSHKKAGSEEESYLAKRASHMNKHPRMIAINEQYNFTWRNCKHIPNTDIREYRKQFAKDFIAKNGYQPTHGDDDPEEKATAAYWSRYLDEDEEMKALYAVTPTKQQYLAMQTKKNLIKFLLTEQRRPSVCDKPHYEALRRNKDDAEVIEALKTIENV